MKTLETRHPRAIIGLERIGEYLDGRGVDAARRWCAAGLPHAVVNGVHITTDTAISLWILQQNEAERGE